VKIVEHQYTEKYNAIGFKFEDDSFQVWDRGVVPGTDIPSIRCHSTSKGGYAGGKTYGKAKTDVMRYVKENGGWEALGLVK